MQFFPLGRGARLALVLDAVFLLLATLWWTFDRQLWRLLHLAPAERLVRLPVLDPAWRGHGDEDRLLIVSVTRDGTALIRGEAADLARRLEEEVLGYDRWRRTRGQGGFVEITPDHRVSALPLRVRADREARWGDVHRVLVAAGRASVFKVGIAGTSPRGFDFLLPTFLPVGGDRSGLVVEVGRGAYRVDGSECSEDELTARIRERRQGLEAYARGRIRAGPDVPFRAVVRVANVFLQLGLERIDFACGDTTAEALPIGPR